MAAKIIDGYLRQKEFIVINVNKPRSESFSLRWDSPLDLEKEIEALKSVISDMQDIFQLGWDVPICQVDE
ncbi:22119_t:CDS:2 [Dentiscutata erythropus]|uniref:22119_t:CDS:1 n=1 Tax=Dentiscutata erythropus TaxID=1348616 RepID=A0A9N9J9A3_9GLOM|nr:22119_t:CDS:2 [Dentiscutata erythropus]